MKTLKRIKSIIKYIIFGHKHHSKKKQGKSACPFHSEKARKDPATGLWVISRFKEAHEILKNDKTFSVWPIYKNVDPHRMFLAAEGERHTEMSLSVKKIISVNKEKLENELMEFMRSRLAQLPTNTSFDFRRQISDPYTCFGTQKVLGMTSDEFSYLEAELGNDHTNEHYLANLESVMKRFLQSPINQTNMIFDMMRFHIQSGKFTIDEASSFVSLIWRAGVESTSILTSRVLEHLIKEKELYNTLLENEAYRLKFIEECLRITPPTATVKRRITAETKIGEVTIPENEIVLLDLISVHRDPEQFPEPDKISLDKNKSRILSFGAGTHQCVGMSYARMESKVSLDMILPMIPHLTLIEAKDQIFPSDPVYMYAVTSLKVSLSENIYRERTAAVL